MDREAILTVAIDLMRFPTGVRRFRSLPVPGGVEILLCILAGDEEMLRQAIESSGKSRETVHEAAAFFVEQILLFPGADSYRVLGATPKATNHELRRNMSLLLRWLHPDLDPRGGRQVFSVRVARAWNDLKTQERRATYDQKRIAADRTVRDNGAGRTPSKMRSANQIPHYRTYIPRNRDTSKGFLRWVMLLLSRGTAN